LRRLDLLSTASNFDDFSFIAPVETSYYVDNTLRRELMSQVK
jgi:hypothetical protein